MKKTSLINLFAAGTVVMGGLASSASADSLSELEALAKKAQEAAKLPTLEEVEKEEPTAEKAVEGDPAPEPEEAPEIEEASLENESPTEVESAVIEVVPEGEEPSGVEEAPLREAIPPSDKVMSVKKEAGEEAPLQEAPKSVEAKKGPEVVEVDLEKRGESLGLLANVSPEAAGVVTFMNGAGLWGEVEESELGKVLIKLLADNEVDVGDPLGPVAQISPLFAEEFMLVLGDGGAEQTKSLRELSEWNDKYQIGVMMQLWALSLELDEDEDAMMDGTSPFESMAMGFERDPDFLLNFVSMMEMPPVLLAARISDDDKRNEFAGMVEMGAGMALAFGAESFPFLSAAAFEEAGISFSGIALDGEGFVESMEDMMGLRESLEEIMDPAAAEDFMNTLKEKDLVLATGVSDEALYLYLGSQQAGLPLVKKGEPSLTSTEELSFADAYLDESLVTVSWASEELVAATTKDQPILGSYIEGVRLGLSRSKAFGDTKNLVALLDQLEVSEKKLLSMKSYSYTGSLSYLRGDGLYSESFGGVMDGSYDWQTPFTLGSGSEDAFLTVQWVESEAGSEVSNTYLETAFETAYEVANLLSKQTELQGELADYKEGFLLFDTKLKTDFLALYQGLRIADQGLGLEGLLEIDLQGTWPTVPNVPEVIIEEGLVPRISFVSAITDREKLAQSWKEVEKSAGNLLKIGGEILGNDIPMQKPMSSQANDLTTWFFPIPMQTDDFAPSITLNDKVMVASTSKQRAIKLANLAGEAPEPQTGVSFVVNFAPMQEFTASWLKLAKENPDTLLTDSDLADFVEEYGDYLEEGIEAMGEFESWSTHMRVEDGILRSTSHLMTK